MNDLSFDALGLVTVAGTALLAASALVPAAVSSQRRPRLGVAAVVRVLGLVGLFVGVVIRHRGEGTAGLITIVVASVVAEVLLVVLDGGGWRNLRAAVTVVAAGAAAIGASTVGGDAAAALAVTGVGIAVVGAVATRRIGVVALPGLFLVASHHLVAHRLPDGDLDRVGLGVAVVGLAAAVALRRAQVVRSGWHRVPLVGWWWPPAAVASFAVAVVVAAQDDPALHAAGLLLAGGTVLATAARHPIGFVALLPGAAATLDALGVADHPVHAAAGLAVATVVAAVLVPRPAPADAAPPTVAGGDALDSEVTPIAAIGGVEGHETSGPLAVDGALHWPVPLAVVFAVAPLWGWSGADLGVAYDESVAVAVAVTGIVGVVAVARLRRRPASSGPSTHR